jgi:hypothetical protein
MEWWLVPLGVVVAAIALVGWVREQRTWIQLHAAATYRPDEVVRLHGELRRAGIRCRYRTVGQRQIFDAGTTGRNQTMTIVVHRDDESRAHAVLAEMRRRGT